MPATQFTNVCFTVNNPENPIEYDEERMHYLVYQIEQGENGTPHFQGYVEFKTRTALSVVKQLLGGDRVHVERRRGTQEEAIAYCKKADTRVEGPWEYGTPKANQQGKRNDIKEFKDAVVSGKRKRDLVEDHFVVLAKYPRFYETLTMMNRPKRTNALKVGLFYGPP